MTKREPCPLCETRDAIRDDEDYRCRICQNYTLPRAVRDDYFAEWAHVFAQWTPLRRAVLTHLLRTRSNPKEYSVVARERLDDILADKTQLPPQTEQAANIIRFIGDHERKTGWIVTATPEDFYAIVGAPNDQRAQALAEQLIRKGQIKSQSTGRLENASLTLDGWERWEEDRTGLLAGDCGIIAMKFGDRDLDAFVRDIVKPTVETTGYRVERIDDQPRAGVIDNIMRDRIRRAPFLLAELSHANNGAYWEAGYAEGLGKPVIYLCTREAWEEGTHFDTNHCTTLIYDMSDVEPFKLQLAASIRNSLNLYRVVGK
jgi:hypothetical protein